MIKETGGMNENVKAVICPKCGGTGLHACDGKLREAFWEAIKADPDSGYRCPHGVLWTTLYCEECAKAGVF